MSPATREPRFLVVDDEEGPREAIRMILKPRFQVHTAASAEEALASFATLRPDVIFMDVKMPQTDGVQLLKRVKALDPQVEVVMITAYASLDTVQRAMRFGAMDYLLKPFAPRELQEAAERALARRQTRAAEPPDALAALIGQMRDLARQGDRTETVGALPDLLCAMLREVKRSTDALAASFFGFEPSAVAHCDLPVELADTLEAAWKPRLATMLEPLWLRPGATAPLPWPPGPALEARGVQGVMVIPLGDEGVPRVAGHLVLYLSRPGTGGAPELAALRPVMDLMVTAIRTSSLLATAGRQATEQSLRALQREILRQISAAALEDPSLDRTVAAITEQLRNGAGYERVQVVLEPATPPDLDRPGRAVLPLVALGRRLGSLVVETSPGARDLDRSERELLRMFSESVALIVRNATLHRELSEANAFLGNLIHSAEDVIVALDPEHRVVTWNPAAERTFHRPLADVQGKPLRDALPLAVAAQLESAVQGAATARTLSIRPQSGEPQEIELAVTCSPLPWGGRGEVGVLLVGKDVTEQRRWEKQIAHSEKLSALGQLAMGMAHDFNNLLQVILGHTQLIASEPGADRVTRQLSTIEQAVRDGVETVGRIKRYARRESGLHPERVDLPEIARQIVEIARPRWTHGSSRAPRITVHEDFQAVPPVLARAAELREVLMNLVLNAADAMSAGGSLALGTWRDGDRVVLSISDTGPGISPDLRRRIFEPFFTTKETGTGLGLSIVSGIVSSHGGTIDVESEPGQGTTFTIRFPAALDH